MHTHASSRLSKQSIHIRFSIATGLNILLATLQTVYAYLAHSVSLLSDAMHNLGDILGLLMAWGAQAVLTWHASERYSYGYKKFTILAALSNALLLILSVGIIYYELIVKFIKPQPAMHEIQVIFVALLATIINGGTAFLFIKEKESDINIKGAFLHLILDAITSIGVALGAVIMYYTGFQWMDTIIAFIISAIILLGSWKLLRRSIDLSLDAVPENINQEAVRTYLMHIPDVVALHDLHIWGLSTQETALTVHLIMPSSFLIDADYQRIQRDLLKRFNIQHVTLQIEHGSASTPCAQAIGC